MQENSLPKDSNEPYKNEQGLNIGDSTLSDNQVGGQAGHDVNQAGRDLFVVNQEAQKNAFLLLKSQEERLIAQFQEEFERISSLISELREQIESQLMATVPESEEKIRDLLSQLQRLADHNSTLRSIDDDYSSCLYAAGWLSSQKRNLVRYAVCRTFAPGVAIEPLQSCRFRNIRDLEKRFAVDVGTYLDWLLTYLRSGLLPRDFDKALVNLDFPGQVYKEAFSSILTDLLDPEAISLSLEPTEMLGTYIDRFLIKEDNGLDLYSNF